MNYMDVTLEKLQKAQNVFLTGGAGVGKTTMTRAVIAAFESEAKKVAKLASTGMSATLIGGQTLHSFFDLGIAADIAALEQNGKLNIKKRVKKLIVSMDLIVIDEISMVSAKLLELIELRLTQAGFQGVLLVVGDFLQLPPVVRGSQSVDYAFESVSWKNFAFETVELTHIYRTDDKEFIELLHNIRFGFVNEAIHNQLNSFIKPLPNEKTHFTFLFGKNNSAAKHNRMQLAAMEGELFIKEVQILKHKKSVKEEEVTRFMKDAAIEEKLELKIGAPVLFTRNSWNYFNGERGVVVNIDSSYIYVQKGDGKVVKLEQVAHKKMEWVEQKRETDSEFVEEERFTIYHYPVKLAFAITIHKSQGMSIENLIIETREIFAPSQFYVALSRSSNPKNLILIAPLRQWYELAYVHPKAMRFVQKESVC